MTWGVPCICIIMQLAQNMLSKTFIYMYISIVSIIDGHGYDGQLMYTVRDICRSCYSKSKDIDASFSSNSTNSLRLQFTQVPRSPDLAIFVSTTITMTIKMTQMIITLPLTHVPGVIRL